MANRFYLSKAAPLTSPDGKLTTHAVQWFERASRTLQGIYNFIGEGDGTLTADEVDQGITSRVIELANQEITRRADGTVQTITYRDPTTLAVILTEEVEYAPDGTLESISGTDSLSRVTTETFTFDGDLISEINVGFSGY